MKRYKPYIIVGLVVVAILALCLLADVLDAEDVLLKAEPASVRNAVPDYTTQATDDLSREQQIELMQECYHDARKITTYGTSDSIMAIAFFEYRTRGR